MNVDVIVVWVGRVGLLPRYDPRTERYWNSKVLSTGVTVFLIAMFVYSCWGKERLGLFRESDAIILKYLPMMGHLFTNLLTIVSSATWNLGRMRIFHEYLVGFDSVAKEEYGMRVPKIKRAYLQFFLTHIYLVLIFSYDLYASYKNCNLWHYQYYVNDVLEYYLIYLVVFFQYCALRNIRLRYWVLNRILSRLDLKSMGVYSARITRIDRLVLLHDRIADLVDLFNAMFGLHMFLSMLQIVIKFVSMIHSILEAKNELEDIVIIIIWNVYIIAQGVVVATKCEQVTNEGRKTVTMAYKALHRYANNQQFQDRLFILAQQAAARCPVFTAAGFFNVDFSMLFTFVNLITTYVIVIIQFSSN